MTDTQHRPKRRLEAEDHIAYLSKKGTARLGIVEKTHDEQVANPDDTEYGDDDDHKWYQLAENQVRVEWYPSGNTSKVYLLDRSLQIGEIVCRADDLNRVGFVTNLTVMADLLTVPDMQTVMTRVNLQTVKPVARSELIAGNSETLVLYKSWLGDVTASTCRLLLRPPKNIPGAFWLYIDGEAVVENAARPDGAHADHYDRDQFYVNQPVTVQIDSMDRALWVAEKCPILSAPPKAYVRYLRKMKRERYNVLKCTVMKVLLDTVHIRWIMALDLLDAAKIPPRKLTNAEFEKCTLLSHFEFSKYQMGDRFHLCAKDGDTYTSYDQWQANIKRTLLTPNSSSDMPDRRVGDAPPPTHTPSIADVSSADASELATMLSPPSPLEIGASTSSHGSTAVCAMAAPPPMSTPMRTLNNLKRHMASSTTSSAVPMRTSAPAGGGARRHHHHITLRHRRGGATVTAANKSTDMARAHRKALVREATKAAALARRAALVRGVPLGPTVVNGQALIGEVLVTHTRCDIQWMDGVIETDITATQLLFADTDLDEHVFVAGNIVQYVRSQDDPPQPINGYGVVKRAVPEQRMAYVDWYTLSDDGKTAVRTLPHNCEHSVIDLYGHSTQYWIAPGKLCIRLRDDEHQMPITTDDGVQLEKRMCGLLGQIQTVDINTSLVTVNWFDGTTTGDCLPTQLLQVLPDHDDDWMDGNHSEHSDETHLGINSDEEEVDDGNGEEDVDEVGSMSSESQSMPSDVEMGERLAVKDGVEHDDIDGDDDSAWTTVSEDSIDSDEDAISYHTAIAVHQQQLPASVTGAHRAHSPANAGSSVEDEPAKRARLVVDDDHLSVVNDADTSEKFYTPPSTNLASDISQPTSSAVEVYQLERSTFEVLPGAPVKHSYGGVSAPSQSSGMRHFWQAVRRECQLLRTALPEHGIHVRTFEQRCDLFTCMFVGPAGTPYEGGLFVFDVQLRSDYPASPPLVMYISHSREKLNPNLYVDGKVCLSLLGTWDGKGSETWTVGSNLLQLFVSIQGLILNATPYFNEAGYEPRRALAESMSRARAYNEQAMVLSLENLHGVISSPPDSLADYVREYARTQLGSVIERVAVWLSDEGTASAPHFPLCPISGGCRLSARYQLDRLRALLDKISGSSAM